MADSWKTDGNCKECRRQKYCSKECTASKRAIRAFIQKVVNEKLSAMTPPIKETYDA